MTTSNARAYYAVIPASVRYHPDVSNGAKLLYGEITALCNERGYCWASNGYFAGLYDVNAGTISRWIKELLTAGFIETTIDQSSGNQRHIRIADSTLYRKIDRPLSKNQQTSIEKSTDPLSKNRIHNNTVNNTVNNFVLDDANESGDFESCLHDLLTDFQEVENLEVENLDIENRTQLKKQLIKETTNQRNTSFVNAAAFENTNAYPIFDLVDAFPDVMFTPGQCDQIANIVKDNPTDRAAWSATIEKYKLDYNPELNRYIPNKVGNLLGVFRSEKSRIERANNGTTNSNSAYRKRSDAEVFAESADFYANYPAEHPA